MFLFKKAKNPLDESRKFSVSGFFEKCKANNYQIPEDYDHVQLQYLMKRRYSSYQFGSGFSKLIYLIGSDKNSSAEQVERFFTKLFDMLQISNQSFDSVVGNQFRAEFLTSDTEFWNLFHLAAKWLPGRAYKVLIERIQGLRVEIAPVFTKANREGYTALEFAALYQDQVGFSALLDALIKEREHPVSMPAPSGLFYSSTNLLHIVAEFRSAKDILKLIQALTREELISFHITDRRGYTPLRLIDNRLLINKPQFSEAFTAYRDKLNSPAPKHSALTM